ncbi:hypothetical protein [Roseateles cavernae]|uniref:hypothetical protein n=1 Tax=Roseateles cavernae TaxID=3153578 RepID=UPI0032E50D3B
MNDQYSQAAADLLKRVAARSRSEQPTATPQIDQVVINRPVNCTFVFGGTSAPASPGEPVPKQPGRKNGRA